MLCSLIVNTRINCPQCCLWAATLLESMHQKGNWRVWFLDSTVGRGIWSMKAVNLCDLVV